MEQNKIYSLIVEGDEVSWKTILLKSIKEENMDPWDINVSVIANRFLKQLKELKELNLRISGKVILAAALLLKLKSKKLIETDLTELNAIISDYESEEDDIYEFGSFNFLDSNENNNLFMNDYNENQSNVLTEDNKLILKTKSPLPRRRKVSIFDLMSALHKALETKNHRVLNEIKTKEFKVPEKKFDITLLITNLFEKLKQMLSRKKMVTFKEVLPESPTGKDIAYAFIPLLHLDRSGKITIHQDEPFGTITIEFPKKDNNLG